MFGLDAPELIIIAVVILILFGSRKLPDAARSLGRSLRIFKAETREIKADEQAAREARGEATRPEITQPKPAGEVPVAAPLAPESPAGEPHTGIDQR